MDIIFRAIKLNQEFRTIKHCITRSPVNLTVGRAHPIFFETRPSDHGGGRTRGRRGSHDRRDGIIGEGVVGRGGGGRSHWGFQVRCALSFASRGREEVGAGEVNLETCAVATCVAFAGVDGVVRRAHMVS